MFRTAAFILVLAIGPTSVFAQATCDHDQQAMSCAEGMVWNAETRSCVQPST